MNSFGQPAISLANPIAAPATDAERVSLLVAALLYIDSEAVNIIEAAEDERISDMVEYARCIRDRGKMVMDLVRRLAVERAA